MCNISFTSLVYDQNANTITLTGSSDCDDITASLVSTVVTTVRSSPVDPATGIWSIVYAGADILSTPAEISDECDTPVKIQARCTSDPQCINHQAFPLICASSDGCPEIILELIGENNDCANGPITRTFRVTVNNFVTPAFYEIDFGDGDDTAFNFDPGNNPVTFTHQYTEGNYTVVVNSIFPPECPASDPIDIKIPVCPESCPAFELELISISPCDNNGQRTATFRINISNAPADNSAFELDFGDGVDLPFTYSNATAASITVSHVYDPGNYTAIIRGIIPVQCPDSNSVLVEVNDCPLNCPVDVEFEIIDSNGNRFRVVDSDDGIFEAVSNNPGQGRIDCLAPGRYIARITLPTGNGFIFTWREDSNPPVSSNSADFPFTLGANTKSINVIIQKDNCPPLGETIIIHPCVKECCPELTGLSAPCMPRCPESSTVTFTAQGNNLDCAEVFNWDFGDGSTAETAVRTVTHTYAQRGSFDAEVVMVVPDNCSGPRVRRATAVVGICPPSCWCLFVSVLAVFSFIGVLALVPLIMCFPEPVMIITLIICALILSIFFPMWLLDPCCRPTNCELLKYLYWIMSWAIVILAVIGILSFCVPALPFALLYIFVQQVFQERINSQNCGAAPTIFSWPFPNCN